jgi:electron transfer flavoprotein beta subunit
MKIIVCIKQVPGTTQVKINPETNTLIREGAETIINPYDSYAIEEGLRVRERCGGTVTILSMGPPQAESALREAISLGADEAVLLSDRAFAGSDTWATSYTLAQGIKKIGDYDLIICGKQAIDGDTAQVGPGIAEFLDIPFVAYIRKIEEINDSLLRVERLMDEGYDVIETHLPALITVVKEINEPRLPSLRGKMNAKKAQIKVLNLKALGVSEQEVGLPASPTKVAKIFTPPPRGNGQMLTGSTQEVVDKLVKHLREDRVV